MAINNLKLGTAIDAAWQELQAFLAVVTADQAAKRDPAGWSVADHVAHLAVWEDSVTILFQGGRRHEGLGLEEPVYAAGDYDLMNERIRARTEGATLQEAMRSLQGSHARLMAALAGLGEADLEAKVCEFFPQAPRKDGRSLARIVWDISGGHFADHLAWMRELVSGAA